MTDSSINTTQDPELSHQTDMEIGFDSTAPEPVPQIAQIRVVVPMTGSEQEQLLTYLQRVTGRSLELRVVIDPSILGGVWVRMDDLVIDGTVRARLEALHEQMCATCRIPEGAGPAGGRNRT